MAICTYNRPAELNRLLDAVESVAREDLGCGIPIVVVDDSADGNARSVVEGRHEPGVRYVRTAASDISIARNTAVRTASALAPAIACIDDDCVPQPRWLAELLRVAGQFEADLVVGHRQFVPTAHSPSWLRQEPFLLENERYEDGAIPTVGNVANVLISSSWLRRSGVEFHHELGRLGGEDMVFFDAARRSGAEIRFAARSVVTEPCDERRSTLRYQLWRQAWLGNNEAHIDQRTREYGRLRLVLRGCRRLVRGLGWPFVSMQRHRTLQLRWAMGLVASGGGLIAGALGLEMRHRS